MSHEFETGFFVKTPAWHELGTVVREAPTTAEAIRLAGLDWDVDEWPVWLRWTDKGEIPTHKALVRSTDEKVLDVVGADYKPLQNSKAFAFFDPFVASGMCELDAAGSLREGKRIWVLARVKGVEGEVVTGDPVRAYFLLYNGHGGAGVRFCFTPIRVVCWNTATAAVDQAMARQALIVIRHTKKVEEAVERVRETVDMAGQTFNVTLEAYRAMAAQQLGVEGLERYVEDVFAYTAFKDGKPKQTTAPRAKKSITRLFEGGSGSDIPGVRGTVWAGYNAVTEFLQNHRGRTDATRLDSAWFADGRRLRDKAFKEAMALLN